MAYKIVNRRTEGQKEYQCIASYLRNDPVEKRGKLKPINKMASSVFDSEIEHFIKPIRGLYKEYITMVEELTTKNLDILKNKVVDTASVCDDYLIYELFGDGEEGEIVKEQVQTWICDNHLEVTNSISTTLRAKKISFANWFRMSEENRSPDELLIYCLSKMSKQHTVIFNKSFPWSTLNNYISYNDVEIAERSTVLLIYVGVSKYAIIKLAPQPEPSNLWPLQENENPPEKLHAELHENELTKILHLLPQCVDAVRVLLLLLKVTNPEH